MSTKQQNTSFEFDSLENLRNRLLDLTGRNQLLNFNINKSTQLTIVNKQPNELYNFLLSEKSMNFLAIPEHTKKQIENAIQTLLNPIQLENTLRNLTNKARTAIEETGSNILYLSLGFLQWYEKVNKNKKITEVPHLAPLFLIPIQLTKAKLDKKTGTYRYNINYSGEDILPNLSLAEKLRIEYKLFLPELNENATPEDYFKQVQNLIEMNQPTWSIKRYTNISLFNFNKLLMYLDLDPEHWPKHSFIQEHPVVGQFFSNQRSVSSSNNHSNHSSNKQKNNTELNYPLIDNADSSQYNAIIKALSGENLIIEGPPGTGKSQTISNIIATALYQGKKVLFVSEKLVALEVVKKYLDHAGLGDFCLELHSHNSQKRKIIDEIKKRIDLQKTYPKPQQIKGAAQHEDNLKLPLESYAQRINQNWKNSGKTIYEILTAAKLYESKLKVPHNSFKISSLHPNLSDTPELNHSKQTALLDSIKQFQSIYKATLSQSLQNSLSSHPWFGIENSSLDFLNKDNITKALSPWQNSLLELSKSKTNTKDELNALSQESPSIFIINTQIQKLNQHKEKIESIFRLDHLPTTEQLQWIKKQLDNTGIFNWFNSSWRDAKHQLLSFVNNTSNELEISIEEIIKKLPALIKYSIEQKELSEYSQYNLLKNQFDKFQIFNEQAQLNIKHWLINDRQTTTQNSNHNQLQNVIERNQIALQNSENLTGWIDYIRFRKSLIEQGLKPLIDAVEHNQINVEEVETAFYTGLYSLLSHEIFKAYPKLVEFNGSVHSHIQKQFCQQKNKSKQLNQQLIAWKLSQNSIPIGNVGGKVNQYTELALLKHEISKKTRHLPIRQLLKRASNALLELKPCFMMGPKSVAQYLSPGKLQFDLLVIDESSQLKPEDALGAILRSHQTIIVGDPKQLPPSSFFNKIIETDDEATALEESESILDAVSPFFSHQQLQWHYRSQHERLIDFSNQHFYDNNLLVFPSPNQQSDHLGLEFTYINQGLFLNNTNHIEAIQIVNSIGQHLLNTPNQSLGVVAMNIKQSELIEQLLDEKSKVDPQLKSVGC